jgi:hypothetical protein
MSYEEQQKQWREANNVKLGTRVRIEAELLENESDVFGWKNSWTPDMKGTEGMIGKVVDFNGRHGIEVRLSDGREYGFPYFVLGIVGDPQLEASIEAFVETCAD